MYGQAGYLTFLGSPTSLSTGPKIQHHCRIPGVEP